MVEKDENRQLVSLGECEEKLLPIIPLDDAIFPGEENQITVTLEGHILALTNAWARDKQIVTVKTRNSAMHQIGTLCQLIDLGWGLKGDRKKAICIVRGLSRLRIIKILRERPFHVAQIMILADQGEINAKTTAWADTVKSSFEKIAQLLVETGQPPAELESDLKQLRETQSPSRVADLAVSFVFLKTTDAQKRQEILETLNVRERLKKVYDFLETEISRLEIRKEIDAKTQRSQREYILRMQREAIDKELKEENPEIEKHKEKIAQLNLPPETKKEVEETLERLSRLPSHAGEYAYLDNWLHLVEQLPWSQSTEDRIDIKEAEEILGEDHYALAKVKKRILEFLAVRKLKPEGKGPILCFIGPPGTGKTSVGKSIARTMERKFIRISLGGVYDESQIRGHRRTYVGALPGVIIENIKKAGSNNDLYPKKWTQNVRFFVSGRQMG